MNIFDYINECTIVAGQINKQNFLFKNRDKTFQGKYKIIHEYYQDVEIAYATDDTEWVEGMNEFGIGFIFAFLKEKEKYDYIQKTTIKTFDFLNKEYYGDFYDEKVKNFKDVLRCSSLDEAKKLLEKFKWNGNYFIGDAENVYSIEIFRNQVVTKKLKFDNPGKIFVRTNYGLDTGGGYAIRSKYNIDGSSAYIRRYETMNTLQGFKNYVDVIKKMSHQQFDDHSSLNVFKTTSTDLTVAQYFMDLPNKVFIYVISEEDKSFGGIENKDIDKHKSKINIIIKNREQYFDADVGWDRFLSTSIKK